MEINNLNISFFLYCKFFKNYKLIVYHHISTYLSMLLVFFAQIKNMIT